MSEVQGSPEGWRSANVFHIAYKCKSTASNDAAILKPILITEMESPFHRTLLSPRRGAGARPWWRRLLPWTRNILALLMGGTSVFLAEGGEMHNMSESCYGDGRMLLACGCESRCHGEGLQEDNINRMLDCWINEQILGLCKPELHQRQLRTAG